MYTGHIKMNLIKLVYKVIMPMTNFDTRMLPATKATPKKLLNIMIGLYLDIFSKKS